MKKIFGTIGKIVGISAIIYNSFSIGRDFENRKISKYLHEKEMMYSEKTREYEKLDQERRKRFPKSKSTFYRNLIKENRDKRLTYAFINLDIAR